MVIELVPCYASGVYPPPPCPVKRAEIPIKGSSGAIWGPWIRPEPLGAIPPKPIARCLVATLNTTVAIRTSWGSEAAKGPQGLPKKCPQDCPQDSQVGTIGTHVIATDPAPAAPPPRVHDVLRRLIQVWLGFC